MQVDIINEASRAASQSVAVAAAKSTGASFQKTLETVSGESSSQYFVEMGDTLSSICREYLQSTGARPTARDIYAAVDSVALANGLQDRNRIQAGSRLDLSVLRHAPSDTPAVSLASASAPAVSSGQSVEAASKAVAGIRPDPLAAVAQGPMEPLAIEISPSQVALAALQPGFASLGLREAPAIPAMPLTASKSATEETEPLSGVGLLAADGEGSSIIPASAAIEKVLKLMENLVEPLSKSGETFSESSPWSQLLSEPAHLTSEFGIRRDPITRRWVEHEGVDIAAAQGTEVTPMRAGEVVYSGWQAGYGKMVVVRHDDGLETVYGHNSKLLVSAGQRVSEDTPLAEVGSTGRSTGPHLHFEVRRNGRAVDPIPYLTATSADVAQTL